MLSLNRLGSPHFLTEKNGFRIFVIVVAGLILTAPVLIYGIPFFSDDAVTHHAVWYVHFSEQLWAGDLYPRWLMGMNDGLGSPVFFYYPPVPFFLTSLLRPFFHEDVHGWYQLGVSACAALIASGLSAYLWLKQIAHRSSALVGAILYMSTPYHLASDLYIRGSLAEYWAFIWMPLILFFTHKLVKGHRLAVVGVALSYGLLIMTHLPTTLIFSPLPLGWAIWFAGTSQRARISGLMLAALVLGAGLSCVYLWPAMTTQELVFLERMSTGYFSYKNWLFFSNFSLWRNEKILVLLAMLDLGGIACCTFLITRRNANNQITRFNAFWFAVAAAGILMMTQLSMPLWNVLTILRKIQFPWRFNAIVSLATTALLTLAVSSLNNSARPRILTAITLLLVIGWIPATGWAIWQAYPFHNPDQKEISYKKKEIEQAREVPEYYPRWNKAMAELDWETSIYEDEWDHELNSRFESLRQIARDADGTQARIKIVEGTGHVNVNSWRPREIRLLTDTPTGMRLFVSQFYFPSWTAQLRSDSADLEVQPSEPDGLISLFVPKGENEVLLQLKQSYAERIGQLISTLSTMLLLAYVVAHIRGVLL